MYAIHFTSSLLKYPNFIPRNISCSQPITSGLSSPFSVRLLATVGGVLLLGPLLDIRVLDGEAPDVEVVADGDDDVDDEGAVDAGRGAEHAEDEGDLVHVGAEGARPARGPPEGRLQDGAQRVGDPPRERQREDVPVGKRQLDEVRRDHLPHAVRVDEPREQREGHEVLRADQRLQVQVRHHEHPRAEEGQQAEERPAAAVAAGAARLDHVARALDRVQDQDYGALDHIPLREGQLVDPARQAQVRGHAERPQHRLLPERGPAHVPRQRVHEHEDQDALDGPVDDAEREGLGVVFVPGLYVERLEGCFV